MATDASLGLQEICHESLDKSDITYSNEDETLHFVSESHEEDLTDESGLDLQETSNNSPDIEGMKDQILSKLHLLAFRGRIDNESSKSSVRSAGIQLILAYH